MRSAGLLTERDGKLYGRGAADMKTSIAAMVVSAVFGELGAYTLTDLSAGWRKDSWAIDVFLKNAFNTRAELARFSECAALTCGAESYTVFAQPRTLGVRFSKEF